MGILQTLAKANTRKSVISARVYRAKTGIWEDHGVISHPGVRMTTIIKYFFKRSEYNLLVNILKNIWQTKK